MSSLSSFRPAAASPVAERLYFGGPILTMDTPGQVEALATAQGRILATGSLADMRVLCGPGTEQIDLAGRTLLPGFIDAHSHFIDTSLRSAWVDLRSRPVGTVTCLEDILDLLRQRAQTTPEGEWLVGWGYDDTALQEMRHPTRDDLDRVSTRHPIVLQHLSGWVTASNSCALVLAGIGADTKDQETMVFHRAADGTPNGVIEASRCPVLACVPAPDRETLVRSLAAGSAQYAAKGCTTVQEGWIEDPLWIDCAREGVEQGLVPLRLVLYPLAQGHSLEEHVRRFPCAPAGTWLDKQGQLVLGAAKLSADGSIQAYTGYLSKPYHRTPAGRPGYVGYPSNNPAWLTERVCALHALGLQVAVHCNGDAAIDMALDSIEEAQRRHQRKDARHILIHCQMAREDQVARMARLGVVPSFFVAHIFYWGDRHADIFMGPERACRMSPCRDALNQGLAFTLHNDTYVTPIDPLLLVWASVNRQTASGRVLGREEQGIPVLDALKAVTINAAAQGFEEHCKGSLAPGKLADFVVLDHNPLAVDPMDIRHIRVVATLVGDKIVFGSLQ